MQAIVTKYFGPGNVRGSRVKATCQAGSVTLEWDDSLNPEANHKAAAFALASKLQWDGIWISGGLPDGSSVWITDPQDARDTFTVAKVVKPYQPFTGVACHCKPGVHRDNCPDCEGTGKRIDFAAIRARKESR